MNNGKETVKPEPTQEERELVYEIGNQLINFLGLAPLEFARQCNAVRLFRQRIEAAATQKLEAEKAELQREVKAQAFARNLHAQYAETLRVDYLALRSQLDGMTKAWQMGTPDVAEGKRETFWCAIKGNNGKLFHRHLDYLNGHIMPLSDTCHDIDPEHAVPVGDDGDYKWTGWHEVSCDQCETQWCFNQEVIAWIRLPRYTTQPQPAAGMEGKQS